MQATIYIKVKILSGTQPETWYAVEDADGEFGSRHDIIRDLLRDLVTDGVLSYEEHASAPMSDIIMGYSHLKELLCHYVMGL